MADDAATVIAYIGAFAAIVGGGVALFNARKAVQWKRAELASNYIKEFTANQQLVFACRALEWNGGRLVVPDQLRPLLHDDSKVIIHDKTVLEHSLAPDISIADIQEDPRLQIYRTAVDGLLSWLNLIDNAFERNLFKPEDVSEIGYWVQLIEEAKYVEPFINAFGYAKATQRLRIAFRGVYTDFLP